ncbi:sigma-70 family RNA polymerase sigma factor [Paenibacillus aurantiacus]|uniref:Sigma-70 family RNA polymerase sigma factor n=1 Tax=Paenibacillus aurantiacus TaxID=1936118 RepID=A0ABV5KXU6_9BACL
MTIDRTALITDNLNLVHKMAQRYAPKLTIDNSVSYDDVFSEGCLGLVKAARDYEPERGFAFSTYACRTIMGYMLRAFQRKGFVSASNRTVEIMVTINKRELHDKSPQEIADAIGCSVTAAAKAKHYMELRVYSIDQSVDPYDDRAAPFENYLPSGTFDDSGVFVEEFLQSLNTRQSEIVRKLMIDQTYREIGKSYGQTFQNVGRHVGLIRQAYCDYEKKAAIS